MKIADPVELCTLSNLPSGQGFGVTWGAWKLFLIFWERVIGYDLALTAIIVQNPYPIVPQKHVIVIWQPQTGYLSHIHFDPAWPGPARPGLGLRVGFKARCRVGVGGQASGLRPGWGQAGFEGWVSGDGDGWKQHSGSVLRMGKPGPRVVGTGHRQLGFGLAVNETGMKPAGLGVRDDK